MLSGAGNSVMHVCVHMYISQPQLLHCCRTHHTHLMTYSWKMRLGLPAAWISSKLLVATVLKVWRARVCGMWVSVFLCWDNDQPLAFKHARRRMSSVAGSMYTHMKHTWKPSCIRQFSWGIQSMAWPCHPWTICCCT